jgi:hypothetical protein
MHINTLLKYLKNANNSIALLENPLSHSIRIRPVIKSRTIKLVENIMELRNTLETLCDENEVNAQTIIQEDIAERERDLKEKLIDLLDNDFENKFVKKLRLDLNDFITPYFLVDYAQIKLNELGDVGPDLVLQALMAKKLATTAKEMMERLDSIDRDNIDRRWTNIDVYQVRNQEEMVNNYIAQASAIFHGLDDVIRSSSKNKAGKIIKRRIRKTKRRNINSRIIKRRNSRNINNRNNRSSRRTR